MSDHVQQYSLRLDSDPAGDGSVLWARGELDLAAAGALRETLSQAARLDAPIVIDCTDVEFLDGAAIGAIIAACKEARTTCPITFRHPNRLIRRVLHISELDHVFDIQD
jgi:anti-anti-sigma factor